MSVEILGDQGGAGRARFGHGVPAAAVDGTGIFDLLLFEWDDSVRADLNDVAARMLGSPRASQQRPLGLYWETYGLDATVAPVVRIRVVPEQRGWIQRLGDRLGLVGAPDEVAVAWEDDSAIREPGRAAHSLRLGLGRLPTGRYTLELSLHTGDNTFTVARSIEVTG